MPNGRKLTEDPEVLKLMLGLGANKGLHGAGLFVALPSYLISRTPVRHLDDLKGKKIRVLASEFQIKAFERLGATPVAMSLGDVLPAIQQGTIDGAISGMVVFTSMSYQDAAKYITTTGQPYIFIIAEYSAKWRASLPPDLQQVIDRAADEEAKGIYDYAVGDLTNARKQWVAKGGELIDLPKDEEASMMQTVGSVATDVRSKAPTSPPPMSSSRTPRSATGRLTRAPESTGRDCGRPGRSARADRRTRRCCTRARRLRSPACNGRPRAARADWRCR